MSSGRLRVKICGMTRQEDIEHAYFLGADAVGLIFYEHSTRAVTIEHARTILTNHPPLMHVVGVVVNPEVSMVQQMLETLPITLLQFHGDESPEFCRQFHKPYIKAIQPTSTAQIESAMSMYGDADALLLDTPSQTVRGGSGQPFDWRIIPENTSKPYILAGGLNEFNVGSALSQSAPCAIDVCSGVEVVPGVKDCKKMNRLMNVIQRMYL